MQIGNLPIFCTFTTVVLPVCMYVGWGRKPCSKVEFDRRESFSVLGSERPLSGQTPLLSAPETERAELHSFSACPVESARGRRISPNSKTLRCPGSRRSSLTCSAARFTQSACRNRRRPSPGPRCRAGPAPSSSRMPRCPGALLPRVLRRVDRALLSTRVQVRDIVQGIVASLEGLQGGKKVPPHRPRLLPMPRRTTAPRRKPPASAPRAAPGLELGGPVVQDASGRRDQLLCQGPRQVGTPPPPAPPHTHHHHPGARRRPLTARGAGPRAGRRARRIPRPPHLQGSPAARTPSPCTNRTRLVPSSRTNWTRLGPAARIPSAADAAPRRARCRAGRAAERAGGGRRCPTRGAGRRSQGCASSRPTTRSSTLSRCPPREPPR